MTKHTAKRAFQRAVPEYRSKPTDEATLLRIRTLSDDVHRAYPGHRLGFARRPGQIGLHKGGQQSKSARVVGARLPSPTSVLDDPATQWIPYRATGSDGSTAMVELASGVSVWYHVGFRTRRSHYVGSSIRQLAERFSRALTGL